MQGPDAVAALAGELAAATRIALFTGAGISTESGIPDFRSPGGIWTQMKPIDFRDFIASEDMRREAWRRKFASDPTMRAARPNRGHRACAYLIANHRRKGVPTPVAVLPELVDDIDPATLAVDDLDVREVLKRLAPRDRQILLLHAWDGLDGESLAAVLGISRGGADAALSRARARLRSAWADVQDQHSS